MDEQLTIDSENYARVCELFEAARQLDSGARAEMLDRECTPLIRAQVLNLIAQDEAAEREAFLEVSSPFGDVPAPGDNPARLLGAQIGTYRIERLIASGGMGHVYLARRTGHYDQHVAFKVIRHRSAELLRRFQSERQVLARLQHPLIARILDAGDTPDGKPWFVMEYIDGLPIDQYCEQHELSTNERIELLERASVAVQHAHEQSVLHRDLKPSNMLVTRDGTPKITDFGLAKRLDLTDSAHGATKCGAVLGSPGYMSPEQARPASGEIGPATDIYALGAILYKLLTGRPPFRAETPLETVLQLVSEDPIAPSRLHARLPRDIEAICLRCLEKDPRRRYGSAAELARDLGRARRHEPTVARPIGVLGRLQRWCRRNAKLAALAGCLALVLLVGFASISYLLRVALGKTAIAQREKRQADALRQQAQTNFRRAMSVIDKYLTRISRSPVLRMEGLEPVRKELLQMALSEYEDLLRERARDPNELDELARAYYRLAYFHRHVHSDAPAAQAAVDRAIAIWEPLAPGDDLFQARLGAALELRANLQPTAQGRLEAHLRAAAIRQLLVAKNTEPGTLSNLAFSYASIAESYATPDEPGLALISSCPSLLCIRDPIVVIPNWFHVAALSYWRQACLIRERILELAPEFWDNQVVLAQNYRSLGRYHWQRGETDAAIQSLQQASDHWKQVVQVHPDNDLLQTELGVEREYAITLSELGELQLQATAAQARQSLDSARAIQERLTAEYARFRPSATTLHDELARTYARLAAIETSTQNWQQAITLLQRSVEILETLAATRSSDSAIIDTLMRNLAHLAEAQERLSNPGEAARVRALYEYWKSKR